MGVEVLFDAIANEVTSFAGAIIDPASEGRDMIVYVADPADSERAVASLRAHLPRQRRAPDRVAVRVVAHSYRTLSDWRDSLFARSAASLFSLDLDEANNRIRLGVRDEHGLAAVAKNARELGVPDVALQVVLAPTGELRTTLQDSVRPVKGGLEFTWTSGTACSVGINGEWSYSSSYRGFLTASHCSRSYMKLDISTTSYYQDWHVTASKLVGTEWDDPLYFTGGICPTGDRCRYSDAMFVKYGTSSTSGLGTISRTTSRSYAAAGSITISGQFTLAGDWPYSMLNEELQKMGRTSGWTYGWTTATCVDHMIPHLGKDYWILCSDDGDIWSEGGDSGSPIFKWYGGSDTTVYFAGILYGGPGSNYYYTWYSPSTNIMSELTGTYGWYW